MLSEVEYITSEHILVMKVLFMYLTKNYILKDINKDVRRMVIRYLDDSDGCLHEVDAMQDDEAEEFLVYLAPSGETASTSGAANGVGKAKTVESEDGDEIRYDDDDDDDEDDEDYDGENVDDEDDDDDDEDGLDEGIQRTTMIRFLMRLITMMKKIPRLTSSETKSS